MPLKKRRQVMNSRCTVLYALCGLFLGCGTPPAADKNPGKSEARAVKNSIRPADVSKARPQPPAAQPVKPVEPETPAPLADPRRDELYFFAAGRIQEATLPQLAARIAATGCHNVVFDCHFWVDQPAAAEQLATLLREKYGRAIILHTLIHPGEKPACTIEHVLAMAKRCRASGVYDDGAGVPHRADEELNACLWPEIAVLLQAWRGADLPLTWFATANHAQVVKGLKSLADSVDPALARPLAVDVTSWPHVDFYRDDPGWGRFSKEYYASIDGAVEMLQAAALTAPDAWNAPPPRARPVLGWIRWHDDWRDPLTQVAQVNYAIALAQRYGLVCSWQVNDVQLALIGPETFEQLADRATWLDRKVGAQ